MKRPLSPRHVMLAGSPPVSRLVLVNRALLAAVDQLETEFPDVPAQIIQEKVGDARVVAARRLPNLAAYRETIEQQARALITTATGAHARA